MSAHVKLGFVKLHRWRNPYYFNVYHGDEGTGWPDTRVNGPPIGLWRYGWEKAGFGHGYFGVGSFGWAQGSKVGGGFGRGRFGLGEVGFYNAPPEWISRALKATGQAAIDTKNKNETQAKLMAQRAAELDAKRNLAQMIAGLDIQSDTTVKDFMTDHDSIRTELSAVIDGAYVKGKPVFTDGMVTVTVELPAARVWKVIADEIKVSQR